MLLTVIKPKLEFLLGPEVYECDAYPCLWSIAEVLALSHETRLLATEFRLKSLDAEMWRSLLKEEAQARQHGYDEDQDDDEGDGDEEVEGGGEDSHKSQHGKEEVGSGGMGLEPMEVETQIKVDGAVPNTTPPSMSNQHQSRRSLSSGTPSIAATPPPPFVGKNSSLQTLNGTLSSPPGLEAWDSGSLFGDEEDDEENDDGSRTGPDSGLYTDYFTKCRHQYRAVITEAFKNRVITFLEGIDTSMTDSTLFARSRPLLHRILLMVPANDMVTVLHLVAVKFSYEEAVHLVAPLVASDEEGFALTQVQVSLAMDWAIDYEGGNGLPTLVRHVLGLIHSPPLLQRMARRAVVHGQNSMPFILRALSLVPPRIHEAEALELGKMMADHWSKETLCEVGHYLIVRALQRQPSLSLYFALKKHVIDGDSGVQRVLVRMYVYMCARTAYLY